MLPEVDVASSDEALGGRKRRVPSLEVRGVKSVAEEDEVDDILLHLLAKLLGDDGEHFASERVEVGERDDLSCPSTKRNVSIKRSEA